MPKLLLARLLAKLWRDQLQWLVRVHAWRCRQRQSGGLGDAKSQPSNFIVVSRILTYLCFYCEYHLRSISWGPDIRVRLGLSCPTRCHSCKSTVMYTPNTIRQPRYDAGSGRCTCGRIEELAAACAAKTFGPPIKSCEKQVLAVRWLPLRDADVNLRQK